MVILTLGFGIPTLAYDLFFRYNFPRLESRNQFFHGMTFNKVDNY